jgi:hypothetical protein
MARAAVLYAAVLHCGRPVGVRRSSVTDAIHLLEGDWLIKAVALHAAKAMKALRERRLGNE